jgi:hypothetical protein
MGNYPGRSRYGRPMSDEAAGPAAGDQPTRFDDLQAAAHQGARAGSDANYFLYPPATERRAKIGKDGRICGAILRSACRLVLSCNNSLPHLLTENLQKTVANIWTKVRPGGLVVTGVRDYDRLLQERPAGTIPRLFSEEHGQRISFQVWEWSSDGRIYTVTLFTLQEPGG